MHDFSPHRAAPTQLPDTTAKTSTTISTALEPYTKPLSIEKDAATIFSSNVCTYKLIVDCTLDIGTVIAPKPLAAY